MLTLAVGKAMPGDQVLDFVEKRLHEPTFTRKRYPPEEVVELLARVRDARAKYLALGRTQH